MGRGEHDEYGRGQTLSLRDPEKGQVERGGRAAVGWGVELPVRKQEETKQDQERPTSSRTRRDRAGQGRATREKTGRDPGRTGCVRVQGRQAKNRLDWNEHARFLCWGWTCPCWRRNACVCARVDVGRYVLPYTIPQHGPWWWEEGVQGAPAGGGERLTLGRVPRGPPGRAWPWMNRCEQCELRGLGELGRWGPAEMG